MNPTEDGRALADGGDRVEEEPDPRPVHTATGEALERERDVVAALRELDRAKSDFVATVSHELRTPLTSTLGFLELLADEAAGPVTEHQRAVLTIMERNGRRLLRLVEDLLALSQLDAGHRADGRASIPVASLLRSATATHEAAADRGGVAIRRDASACRGAVAGDETSLVRALSHIVGNGVKFTRRGGSVAVSCREDDDPGRVVILVEDTGVGIPEAEQSRLFTRFYRSPQARAEALPGTGLGLALARELVESQGGSVALASQSGRGTTVTVTLRRSSGGNPS